MKKSVFIAVVSLFSALSAALIFLIRIPSPTGGYTHIGDSIIYIAAVLFGPYVGLSVGIIGPAVADFLVGYPRLYVTVVAHGVQGFVAGLSKGKSFTFKVFLMFIGGVLMSLTYFFVNIYIKGFAPAVVSLIRDIFGQTLVSVIVAAPVVKALENNPVVKKIDVLLGKPA